MSEIKFPERAVSCLAKSELVALSQRDRDLFYVSVPENLSKHEPPRASGVISAVVFSYLTTFYMDRSEVEQRFIGRIGELEFSILDLRTVLRALHKKVLC